MIDIYRIVDRYTTSDKDEGYIIETKNRNAIGVGETVYDLRGNEFQVVREEILPNNDGHTGTQRGYIFKSYNHCRIMGNLLSNERPQINFLFSSHPLFANQIDEDYEEELKEASKYFPCGLFSLERFNEGRAYLFGDAISGIVIYRGWMLPAQTYRKLYEALEARGLYLINTPEEYERYHHLPNWYDTFKNDTAPSVWVNSNKLEDIEALLDNLTGAYIVKDFVKSRKHEWHEACYIPNIQDTQASREIIHRFIQRQADQMIGGIVLRKFEELKSIGHHEASGMPLAEEYRAFVYAGNVLTIDDYWNSDLVNGLTNAEREWIDFTASKTNSNFMTIDLARKEDGTLMIMELGDGQVSGLQELSAVDWYRAFSAL